MKKNLIKKYIKLFVFKVNILKESVKFQDK